MPPAHHQPARPTLSSRRCAQPPVNPDGGGAYGEEEETVLSPGTVIGFPESLLPDKTLSHSYTAASFVHLLFFDRAAVMAEAERRPQLLRSIWWLIAAKVGRRARDWLDGAGWTQTHRACLFA